MQLFALRDESRPNRRKAKYFGETEKHGILISSLAPNAQQETIMATPAWKSRDQVKLRSWLRHREHHGTFEPG